MLVSIAPTSAAAVANSFLELGWKTSGVPPIDQLKLQKLLFYAHAWYLAFHDKPLFEEDFEAWPWGPVVRDIYFQTARFGRSPIDIPVTRLVPSATGSMLDARFESPSVEDSGILSHIEAVWSAHKHYTGIQLSNSTHNQGEPWRILRNHYGDLEHKPTIPNDLIAQVFKQKIKNDQPANSTA
jgi:uncharacterized phage-associated protein